MKVKRGRVLTGCKSIMCGALALGMAGCSSSVKLPTLVGAPEQRQEMSCESLNAERATAAERDDISRPQLSSEMAAEQQAELTQLNGKLYTMAKAQFDKSCPAMTNGATGSVVR